MSDPLSALGPPATQMQPGRWTTWLIWFLRAMAVVSLIKGLYHWALLCGIGDSAGSTFEANPMPWKAATIYFAVIDLVAAVGLWLAAAWGGVVWLTAAISLIAIELFFPQVYGGQIWVVAVEVALIATYLTLALGVARERPH